MRITDHQEILHLRWSSNLRWTGRKRKGKKPRREGERERNEQEEEGEARGEGDCGEEREDRRATYASEDPAQMHR